MLPWIVVGVLGAIFGIGELLPRYRDQPGTLPRVPSAWLYTAINITASVGTFWLAQILGWKFGQVEPASIAAYQVVFAGFGSAAVLRSSFSMRAGEKMLHIDPSVVLVSLLAAADRGVDRRRAQVRATAAARIMAGVSFELARRSLPVYCLGILQNASATDQTNLHNAVEALANSDLTDTQKSRNLGLILMTLVGPEALEASVNAHSGELVPVSSAPPQPVTR